VLSIFLPNKENPIVKKSAAIIFPFGSRLLSIKRNKLKRMAVSFLAGFIVIGTIPFNMQASTEIINESTESPTFLTWDDIFFDQLKERFGSIDLDFIIQTHGFEIFDDFNTEIALQIEGREQANLEMIEAEEFNTHFIDFQPFLLPCPGICGGTTWVETGATSWANTGLQRVCSWNRPGVAEQQQGRWITTTHRGACGWSASGSPVRELRLWCHGCQVFRQEKL
jgi:hypothetical protein